MSDQSKQGFPLEGGSGPATPPPGPRHHVPEEILVEYVAGEATAGPALAIACHLTLCPRCRTRLATLESRQGAALERMAPVAPAPGALATLLGKLDHDQAGGRVPRDDQAEQVDSAAGDAPAVPAFLAGCGLPRPLLRLLSEGGPARWRFLAPGVQAIELSPHRPARGRRATRARIRLLKLRHGLEIPWHDHRGAEYTVIFTGALTEGEERFARGDLAVRLPSHRHVQRVERQQDCVALQVNEGPLQPLTWKGWLLTALAGATGR